MLNHGVACCCFAFAKDTHVPSAAHRQRHGLGRICATMKKINICTWSARLRHFEYDAAPKKAIAYADQFFVGTKHSQILAEAGGLAVQVPFRVPPGPMVGGVDAHGQVRPAVYFPVGLRVACERPMYRRRLYPCAPAISQTPKARAPRGVSR